MSKRLLVKQIVLEHIRISFFGTYLILSSVSVDEGKKNISNPPILLVDVLRDCKFKLSNSLQCCVKVATLYKR